jgi:hypothetical protein
MEKAVAKSKGIHLRNALLILKFLKEFCEKRMVKKPLILGVNNLIVNYLRN